MRRERAPGERRGIPLEDGGEKRENAERENGGGRNLPLILSPIFFLATP